MIELIQHKISNTELNGSFSKLNEITISMNRDIISKDINRLQVELFHTTNKYNKANLKGLIQYLEKLLKNIDEDGHFELCWVQDGKSDIPYTYPVKLINEPLYNINMCNYIELDTNEKVVEIDLTDLADIIAFEFMYKDLGETHESIEELLKDCGIIGFEDSKLLLDMFKENNDKMFELSKTMLIGDSPYKSFENKSITDYFHSKEFRCKEYKGVVDYSCRYANTMIANTILKNYLHKNKAVKLLAVNATTITLVTDIESEVNIDEISIRVFGRRFMIEPKISVL